MRYILKHTVLVYGLIMGLLIFLLKMAQYKYVSGYLRDEGYISITALAFLGLGIWAGFSFFKYRDNKKIFKPEFHYPENGISSLSSREYEVLSLIAQGLSNKEIADRLFVSTNTVKTHVSNILSKLNVSRRTQAILIARELKLLA